MEFVTSIVGSKAPRDGAALSVALGLQGGDALAQVLHAGHPTRQTATRKDADLDFSHIQPAAMDAAYNGTPPVARCVVLLGQGRLHTRRQPCAYSDYPA